MARPLSPPWPHPDEIALCRGLWQESTPADRRQLCALRCGESVLYLRVCEAMLTMKGQADVQEERARYNLRGLTWKMQRPRELWLSLDVCDEDFFEGMLAMAARDLGERDEIRQHATSGRVGVDMDVYGMLSGRASTWKSYARDFYTLIVDALLQRAPQKGKGAYAANIHAALTSPRATSLRSWPAKRAMAELREEWSGMSAEERVEMSALSRREYWFVQACDLSVMLRAVEGCDKEHAARAHAAARQERERFELCSSVEVSELEGVLHLSRAFVEKRDCLEQLLRRSVHHANEKTELARLALDADYEAAVTAQEDTPFFADPGATWKDVERVLATLLLEGLLQKAACARRVKEGLLSRAALAVAEAAARRQAANARKAARRRVRREETRAEEERLREEEERRRAEEERLRAEAERLRAEEERQRGEEERLRAEEVRQRAEEERQRAEEQRQRAEEQRQRAEEVRQRAEEVRQRAEEERHRAEEMRQLSMLEWQKERARIWTLLASAPQWQEVPWISRRTFVEVDVFDDDKATTAFCAEW